MAPADPLEKLPGESRARLERGRPRFVKPMLATLTDERDLDDDWVLEHKLDGERCLALVAGGDVTLMTRSARDVTSTYPEIVEALAAQGGTDAVLDGEIVAIDGDEALGFERLQRRLGNTRPSAAVMDDTPVALYAFDLLHIGGCDLTKLPLADRIDVLHASFRPSGAVRLSEGARGDSRRRYEAACSAGWEGLVAKRLGSRYVSGRSREWLKLKCVAEQELVIGGFTAPRGSRVGLGAVLVGYFDDGRLRYAGKVGTGFDRSALESLTAQLRSIERDDSPFSGPVAPRPAGVRWVEPRLVAQIGFAEWTRGGRLRHPRFLGLRDDKPPEQVVRESPA